MSLLLLLALLPAQADRHVSTLGDDAGNSCTDAAVPCATLEHALMSATSGDSVFVAAGTYSNTASAYPMTVPAGVSVVGDGAEVTVVVGTDALFQVGPTDEPVLLQDLTLSGAFTAVQSTDAPNLRFVDVDVEDVGVALQSIGYIEAGGTIEGGTFSNVDTIVLGGASGAGAHIILDGLTATSGSSLVALSASLGVTLEVRNTEASGLEMLGYINSFDGALQLTIEDSDVGAVVASGFGSEPHEVRMTNVSLTDGGLAEISMSSPSVVELDQVTAPLWSWQLDAEEVVVTDSILGADDNLFNLWTPGVTLLAERCTLDSPAQAIYAPDASSIRVFDSDIVGDVYLEALADLTAVMSHVDAQGDVSVYPTTSLDLRMTTGTLTAGTLVVYGTSPLPSVVSIDDFSFSGDPREVSIELAADVEIARVAVRDRTLAGLNISGSLGRTRVVDSFFGGDATGLTLVGSFNDTVHIKRNAFANDFGWLYLPFSLPAASDIDLNAFRSTGTYADVALSGPSLGTTSAGDIELGRIWLTTDDPTLADDQILAFPDVAPSGEELYTALYTFLSHTLEPIARTQFQTDQGGPIWIDAAPGSPPFVARSGQERLTVEVGGLQATDVVVSADGMTLTAMLPPLPPGVHDITVTNPLEHMGTTSIEVVAGLPGGLGLELGPLVLGETSSATVTGATPNARVTLAVTANTLGTPVCPPPFSGACSALPADPAVVLQGRADGSGVAVFDLRIPGAVPSNGMVAQAFVLAEGVASPGVVGPWLDDSGDADADGLDNGAELAAGSDALNPDSDGDRCGDGVDTQPTVPSADADRDGYPDDCPRF